MVDSSNTNHDSRHFNSVQRRNYLQAIGTASIGSLGLSTFSKQSRAAPDNPNQLTIEGSGGWANYSFTVDGSVDPVRVNDHETIRSDGADGYVGSGYDRYAFSGSLAALDVNGKATVRLNDNRIDPASYPENVLLIEGSGGWTNYSFTVSGNVEPIQVNDHESVRNDGADGHVGGGIDRYAFSGKLAAFDLDGEANVTINGKPAHVGQRPDHVLTIRGTGGWTDYSFTVDGSVEPIQVNDHESIRTDGADGYVGGGMDRYAFSGKLAAFDVNGKAIVRLDGDRIDPASYPEHVLTIEGSGGWANYSFTVDGNVDPVRVNDHETVRADGADGYVGSGYDRYAFSGGLAALDVNGDATVQLNGDSIDPGDYPNNTMTVEGSGGWANYSFTVDGSVDPIRINDHETIRSDGADGYVGSGYDRYAFSGDFRMFSLNGDADVYVNDEQVDPDSLGGAGLKLGYDARARSHRRGDTFEDFSDLSLGWSASHGQFRVINDWDGGDGGAVRLIGDRSDNRVRMAANINRDFTGEDLSIAVRLQRPPNETLRVELRAQTPSDTLVTNRYLSAKHGWVRVALAPSQINGRPDISRINRFTIGVYTGGKDIALDIDDIRRTNRRERGAVVMTFDDANDTDYTNAFDAMQPRDIPGTSAIIPRSVGNDNKLSLSQMNEMQNNGWCMASHPQARSPSGGLGSIPGDEAEQMMRDTKRYLQNHGFNPRTLVWPFGDFDREALELAGLYHDLSFGGGASTSNGLVADAGWVPRVNTDNVEASFSAIDYAARTNTVAVLMSHGVGGSRLPMSDFTRILDRINNRPVDALNANEYAAEQ